MLSAFSLIETLVSMVLVSIVSMGMLTISELSIYGLKNNEAVTCENILNIMSDTLNNDMIILGGKYLIDNMTIYIHSESLGHNGLYKVVLSVYNDSGKEMASSKMVIQYRKNDRCENR